MSKNPFCKADRSGRLIFDFKGWAMSDEGKARILQLANNPITRAIREGKTVKTDDCGVFISITAQ